MITKKTILSLVAVFAALFLISFASATLVFSPSTVNGTANPGAVVPLSFGLNNSDNATYSVSWSVSSLSASWSLPTSTSSIGAYQNLTGLSASFTIPSTALPGLQTTYTITANASNDTFSTTAGLSALITVNQVYVLSLATIQPITRNQNGTINVTNTGNMDFSTVVLSAAGDYNVSLSPSTFALAHGASQTVAVTPLLSEIFVDTLTISATGNSGAANASLSYTVYGDFFCDDGNVNTSKLDITSIDDSADWDWEPLDDVTVEVEVENNVGDDEDFVVEIALWDTVDHDFIELNGEDYLEEFIFIEDDDSDSVSFDFEIPIELEDSNGRYELYVKAYVDGDEDSYCNSYAASSISDGGDEIKVTKISQDIVLRDLVFPELVKAGDTVDVSARAFNLGSLNQDKVMVVLSNTKLGLDIESSSFELDSGESNLVDFSFVVPTTAENGIYTLKLISYFGYRENSDYYSKNEETDIKITVGGGVNATTTGTGLSGISASLESDAKAGSDLEITTTITNLGAASATFVVSALDYESWATLNSISDRTIILAAGESEDITISLKVNEGVSGEQTFKIESRSGTKIDSKIVAVEIGGESLFSSLASSFGSNTTLWIVGIVNVLLIVLIIFLVVKVFRR